MCSITYLCSCFLNISYIISIINFFCCFLLLGKLFTWNIHHYKIHIQHHFYTTFEKIFSFSCLIFKHMQFQRVTLITRKCVFIFHLSGQGSVLICIGSTNKGLKAPLLSCHAQILRYWWKIQCMFPRVRYQCQLKLWCVSVELGEYGLTARSDKPEGVSACPQRSIYTKLLTPKDGSISSWKV